MTRARTIMESEKEKVKLIQWEDYEQEAARLWSLSTSFKEIEQKKLILKQNLNSLIQRAEIMWTGQSGVT